jgi:hypothetical protein
MAAAVKAAPPSRVGSRLIFGDRERRVLFPQIGWPARIQISVSRGRTGTGQANERSFSTSSALSHSIDPHPIFSLLAGKIQGILPISPVGSGEMVENIVRITTYNKIPGTLEQGEIFGFHQEICYCLARSFHWR